MSTADAALQVATLSKIVDCSLSDAISCGTCDAFLSLARCSRSRPDGFDQEADLLASANAGDYYSENEGEQPRPSRDETSLAEGDDFVKRGCDAKVMCQGVRFFTRNMCVHFKSNLRESFYLDFLDARRGTGNKELPPILPPRPKHA